jgi:hypothetical protein
MEQNVKSLRRLRQELVSSTNSGLKFSRHNIRNPNEILDDMDKILDEMENSLTDDCKHLSKLKNLEHHKQFTTGLYAIDFDPKELIKRFVDSQSDATRLFVEDVEDLIEDWGKFIDDKNIGKSPFFRI